MSARLAHGPRLVAALLLVVLSTVLVAVNVSVNRGISPFDEATHADYAYRIAHGELPEAGDLLVEEVLHQWACRGAAVDADLPACGGPYDEADFPAGASQYNSAHPPLYYAVTGVVARAVSGATAVGFVDAARLLGAVWLSAGLLVLLAALRLLGTPWTTATALCAVAALTPSVMHASSTVNNDAAALLAGALVLWVTLRVVRGEASWPSVAVVTFLVVVTKVIFAAALVPAVFVLLLRAVRRPHERARILLALSACTVSAVATVLAWSALQGLRGDPQWINPVLGINTRLADEPPVGAIVETLLHAWPPVAQPFLESGLSSPPMALWVSATTLLFASAALVGAAGHRSATGRDVSIGAALGLLFVPVAIQLHTFATTGYYFPDVAPRYALVLVPALVLALAAGSRGRVVSGLLAAAACVGTGIVLTDLLLS